MAVAFRTVTVRFDPTKGRKQTEPATVVFGSRVNSAQAAVKGFNIGFTDGDHNVFRQEIDVDITAIQSNTVSLLVDFLLRDSSGNIDDRYDGWVEIVVIADVA